jgi:tRNA U34 5-carboxymethylaminomethyl modifying enzyme MnmG/GidA
VPLIAYQQCNFRNRSIQLIDIANSIIYESWELDALEPRVITQLIEDAVAKYTDEDRRRVFIEKEADEKKSLAYIADNWEEVGLRQEDNHG